MFGAGRAFLAVIGVTMMIVAAFTDVRSLVTLPLVFGWVCVEIGRCHQPDSYSPRTLGPSRFFFPRPTLVGIVR